MRYINVRKLNTHLLTITLTACLAIGVGIWYIAARASGTGTLSLTPASGSFNTGSNLIVEIHESTTDAIDSVTAEIQYDPAKLQFVNIDTLNSAFDIGNAPSEDNGRISISRGLTTGTLTGDHVLAAVTFKVLSTSGNLTLDFGLGSAIIKPEDGSNVWNGQVNGGIYSITTPTPTPTPTPNTPTPTVATIRPAPSVTAYPYQSYPTNFTIPSGYPMPKDLPPGFSIADLSPKVSNYSGKEPVYFVTIKCLDSNGGLIASANVTLDTMTIKSDKTGLARFTSVVPGKHVVFIESKGSKIETNIEVKDGKAITEIQQFDIKLKPNTSLLPWAFGGIGLIVLIVGLIIIIRWFLQIRNNHHTNTPKQKIIKSNSDQENSVHSSGSSSEKPQAKSPTDSMKLIANLTLPKTPSIFTPVMPSQPTADKPAVQTPDSKSPPVNHSKSNTPFSK